VLRSIQARAESRAISAATTVLFGLPGVRVERAERRAEGTGVVDVVTDELTAVACPSCGMVSRSVKERVVALTDRYPLWRMPYRAALEQGSLAMPRRLLSTEVVYALSKGRVASDGAIRGHAECNNCSGRDSTAHVTGQRDETEF
jgi:hypothetical protein